MSKEGRDSHVTYQEETLRLYKPSQKSRHIGLRMSFVSPHSARLASGFGFAEFLSEDWMSQSRTREFYNALLPQSDSHNHIIYTHIFAINCADLFQSDFL